MNKEKAIKLATKKVNEHYKVYEIDAMIENTVKEGLWVAQEYLDTIVECLKNTHNLGDLEIQEMVDESFYCSEQFSDESESS
jgi:hypothetical protein